MTCCTLFQIMPMKKHHFFFIISLFTLSACLPASTPAPPSIETIVAATYAAAKAQTAAAMPTATLIPPTATEARATFTPYPSATSFVIPSATATFTITPTPAYTATNITSGSGDILYACNVVETSPASGYVAKPGEEFIWWVRIENIGTAKWWPETAYIKYSRGAEYHIKKEAAVGEPTDPGEIAVFKVKMRAPKDPPGTYTTTWSMRKGIHEFCFVQLRIVVKK